MYHFRQLLGCNDCDKCVSAKNLLLDKKLFGDDDNVWKSDKSASQMFDLEPGATVMGDVSSLGWVVLKRSTFDDNELVNLSLEKIRLLEISKKTKSQCHGIQSHKGMDWESLTKPPKNEGPFFDHLFW